MKYVLIHFLMIYFKYKMKFKIHKATTVLKYVIRKT